MSDVTCTFFRQVATGIVHLFVLTICWPFILHHQITTTLFITLTKNIGIGGGGGGGSAAEAVRRRQRGGSGRAEVAHSATAAAAWRQCGGAAVAAQRLHTARWRLLHIVVLSVLLRATRWPHPDRWIKKIKYSTVYQWCASKCAAGQLNFWGLFFPWGLDSPIAFNAVGESHNCI